MKSDRTKSYSTLDLLTKTRLVPEKPRIIKINLVAKSLTGGWFINENKVAIWALDSFNYSACW